MVWNTMLLAEWLHPGLKPSQVASRDTREQMVLCLELETTMEEIKHWWALDVGCGLELRDDVTIFFMTFLWKTVEHRH